MAIDLTVALRTLNHELRSPASVLHGYLEMLLNGRVDEADRVSVLERMQRASARLGLLTQQTSDLLRWTRDDLARERNPISIPHLVDRLEAGAAGDWHLTFVVAPDCRGESVAAMDDGQSLVTALLAVAHVAVREHGGRVTMTFRAAEGRMHVGAFPTSMAESVTPLELGESRVPLALDRAGLGMSLFAAVAVIEAHGGEVWQRADGPVVGATLRWMDHS